jgi:hypothetical protein
VPAAWRTLDEIAAGGGRAQARITKAVNAARRRAWAAIEARHGALPGVRVADKMLQGVTCLRPDASVVACHPDKAGAEPNFKGFGLHPVRREALSIRAEVKDHRRCPCRSRGVELRAAVRREVARCE